METKRRVKKLDESHDKILDEMKVAVDEIRSFTFEIKKVIYRFDISEKINDDLKSELKELKEEIDKEKGKIIVLETKQNGVLTSVKTIAPWLITLGYFIFNQMSK